MAGNISHLQSGCREAQQHRQQEGTGLIIGLPPAATDMVNLTKEVIEFLCPKSQVENLSYIARHGFATGKRAAQLASYRVVGYLAPMPK